MKLPKVIIEMLSQRAECDVTTPAGATILYHVMMYEHGEHLALNTIKRLTGVLPYNGKARISTLDVVARFLGKPSWEILSGSFMRGSVLGIKNPYRSPASIRKGATLCIEWTPDRKVALTHRGEGVYDVIESENSTLQVGDIVTLGPIAIGFPLVAHDVVRNGESLGCYFAARDEGIIIYYCK